MKRSFSVALRSLPALTILLAACPPYAAKAQDQPQPSVNYPYAPLNPYPVIPPTQAGQPGANTQVPWPWNPLGNPPPAMFNQTSPDANVPMPKWPDNSPYSAAYPQPPKPQPTSGEYFPDSGRAHAYTDPIPGFQPPKIPSEVDPATMPSGYRNEAEGADPQRVNQKQPVEQSVESQAKLDEQKKEEARKAPDDSALTDKTVSPEEKAEAEAKKKKEEIEKIKQALKEEEADKKKAADAKEQEEKRKKAFAEMRNDSLRQAMFELNAKQYGQCMATLSKVLSNNPNNPQAHYLKAVCNVMQRQYGDAASEYKEVLRLTPDSDLGRRAAEGLRKINF
jgi:tetratricopeptide (TPR) repeat protein